MWCGVVQLLRQGRPHLHHEPLPALPCSHTPELRVGGVCEREVGLVEGAHGTNVLPVALEQVGLHLEAKVLGTRNDVAAKVVLLAASD